MPQHNQMISNYEYSLNFLMYKYDMHFFGFSYSKEETVNFKQFMRVLARFRPTKTNVNKNKLNTREEKLKCKLNTFSFLF